MMQTLAVLFTGLTAFLHLGFLILEMFLWTTPFGRKIFRNTPEKAAATRVLAANQGLYNGFLAAGLVWSLLHPDPVFATELKVFFLVCVVAAAIYGAWSVSRRILWVQGGPALLALLFVFLAS